VTVTLGDPDAAYLARCSKSIEDLLRSLAARGIEAVVTGIDRYGRPAPSEGSLHLFARARDAGQEQAVAQARSEVETEHGVSICVMSGAKRPSDIDQVSAQEPHFAWDNEGRQLVRRNWEPERDEAGRVRVGCVPTSSTLYSERPGSRRTKFSVSSTRVSSCSRVTSSGGSRGSGNRVRRFA
jgi:hypothetical protein